MIEAARLSVVVTADITKAQNKFEKIDKEVRGLGQSFSTLDEIIKGSLREIGSLAVHGFKNLVSEVGETIKTAASFEQQMSRVSAITQASEQDMFALTSQAKELGATTSFSAKKAAEGMEFLGMAGFDTNQILSAMPGMLSLAAAGNLELGRAADIASNVLTGMGMEAEEMTRIADVMAATITTSNTNVQQLGRAMSYAAPLAGSLGFSIEETSAAIGKLSDAGLQGTAAGTGLRQVLSTIVSPTIKAEAAMNRLGIELFNLDGNIKPLPSVIQEFSDATAGMTTEQKAAELGAIFQTRAMNSMLVLMNEGGKDLEEYSAQLSDVGGTAERIAKTQLDNLLGQITILQSAWEGFSIAVGELALPVLRKLVDVIIPLVSSITSFIEKLKLSNEPLELFRSTLDKLASSSEGWSGALFSAIKSVVDAIVWLGQSVSDMKSRLDDLGLTSSLLVGSILGISAVILTHVIPALVNLGATILSVLSPLGLIIAAATALYIAWEHNFIGIRDVTTEVVGEIVQTITNVIGEIPNIVTGILLILQGDWDAGWQMISDSALGIFSSFKINILDKVTEIVSGIITRIAGATPVILYEVGQWATAFINWATQILPPLLVELGGIIAGIIEWIGAQVVVIVPEIAKWLSAFVEWSNQVLPLLLVELGHIIAGILEWIGSQSEAIILKVAEWIAAFVGWSTKILPLILIELGHITEGILGWIGAQVEVIVPEIAKWTVAFWEWASQVLPPLLVELGKITVEILEWIGNQLTIIVPEIAKWATAFWEWTHSVWPDLLIGLFSIISNMLNWIIDVIPEITATLASWGGAFANWVLQEGWPQLYAALEKFIPFFIEWIALQAKTIIDTFILEWVPAFIGWVQEVWPEFEKFSADFVLGIITWIINTVPAIAETFAFHWVPAFLGWLVNDIIPGISSALGDIWTFIQNWILETISKIIAEDSVGMYLLKNILDQVIPENVSDRLQNVSSTIFSWLYGLVEDIQHQDSVGSYIYKNIIEPINLENIIAALAIVAQGIFNWLIETANAIRNAGSAKEIGIAIIEGVKVGIESAWAQLSTWFGDLWGHLIVIAKSALGIASPSSLFAIEIGVNIVLGVIAGIASGWNALVGIVSGLFSGLVGFASDVISKFYQKGKELVGALERGAKDKWSGVVSTLQGMFGQIGANLSGGITEVSRAAGSLVSTLPHIVRQFTTGLDTGSLFASGASVMMALTSGMQSGMSSAESVARSTTSGVISAIQTAWNNIAPNITNNAADIGSSFINGIVSGIQSGTPNLISSVSSLGTNMMQELGSFLGIRSPSKLAASQIGEPITEGIAMGIETAAPKVYNAMEAVVTPAASGQTSNTTNIDNRQFVVNSYPQKSISEADDLKNLLATA